MASQTEQSWTWSDLVAAPAASLRISVLSLDVQARDINVLTLEALGELGERLAEASSRSLQGVIVTSRREDFLAGADVDVIASVETAADGTEKSALGQRILSRLASLGIPTIAAIHGSCLGGGAELACWCSARVASLDDRTRIGFPEVQLGIVPGFGGTQILPRLVGLAPALALATTGRQVGPLDALRMGLVDAVVPREHLLPEAARLVDLVARGRLRRRTHWSARRGVRAVVAWKGAKAVAKATGGHYPAAAEIVRLCRLSLDVPLERGLAEESRALGTLLAAPVAQSLLHLYAARREAERAGVRPTEGAHVGVVGAGVMGAGIAGIVASRGHRARLRDLDAEALGRGVAAAQAIASRSGRRSVRRAAAMQAASDRITWSLALDGLAEADLVVEAIVERADVKKAVLRDMERACGPATLIATNTSSLSVDDLASALRDPSRFVGLHFFNPVDRMPLVEIVRGRASSPDAIARAVGWARALGKVPVVVSDSPGFVVNRILMPYLDEAFALLAEGVSISSVDAVARKFGMPMGPFRLLDEIGLDVAAHVSRTFASAFPERFTENTLLARMVGEGRLGRKSGRGFYEKRGRTWRAWTGLPPASAGLDGGVIQDRLFLRMADEGMRCLEERVARSPRDIDLATVFGIGFPAFRGGLARWIEAEGARSACARLLALKATYGTRFTPSRMLSGLEAATEAS